MATKTLRFDLLEPGAQFTGLYVGGTTPYTKVSARKAVVTGKYNAAFPNNNAFAVKPSTLVTVQVHDDPNDPDNPLNLDPEYVAHCERQAAEQEPDLTEDYPGQHITGPDYDTRDREGR